jgi:glycosyltransferase involved in cell wall biosynthesis
MTQASERVAVIVPVFNRPTLALLTLQSVLSQSRLPERLIVIDDGSTDDTERALRQWIELQHAAVAIELHGQPHGGVSKARNLGLSQAGDATLVAFLDSDDCWPSDFLERAVMAMGNMPNAVAVSSDQLFEPPDGILGARDLSFVSTRWLITNGAGIGSCTLFRRNAVLQAGGYDEKIVSGADLRLFLDISLKGPWAHVTGAPVRMLRGHDRHRGESGNLSLSRPDNWASWATIICEFLVRHGKRSGLSDAEMTQLVSTRWHDAARNLVAGGRLQEACQCYERALQPNVYLQLVRDALAQS